MSRLFAPLTKHRRDKQAKQRSLDIDSKNPALTTKSSSLSNGVKEKATNNANSPYHHPTTNSRPTTPPPVIENTNVPILHPLTPPQSPRAEPRPDITPAADGPEPASDLAPVEGIYSAPEASISSSPAPLPVLEAIRQPLYGLNEAAAREPDLVDQDSISELEHLSTEELRSQWEDQEIERFLRVFSRVCYFLWGSVQDIDAYHINSKSTKCAVLQIFLLPRERFVQGPIPTYRWCLQTTNARILTK